MTDRSRLLYLAVGVALGLAAMYLVDHFPGGRGKGERVAISYREGAEYRVRHVVDGDTVILDPGIYVRYAGVDTPEVKAVVKSVERFGPEAAAANRELVEGRKVRLRFGPRKLDRYGRVLACVEVRDPRSGKWLDVGAELVRRGLAERYFGPGRAPNHDRVARALESARSAGRGLWSLKGRGRR